MSEYNIRIKVDQIVTKDIRLVVVAGSEEEAVEKAREALQTYPDAHEVKGVRRIQTENSKYWIPRDVTLVSIEEEKEPA